MLDDVEQDYDIHGAKPAQVRGIGDTLQDVKSRPPAMVDSVLGELDAVDRESARGSLRQKESVGAAQLEQLATGAEATNEVDAAGEFAAQHGLGAKIVGIAVGMSAGKIVFGVVGVGIERSSFRTPEAAGLAL